MDSPSDRLIASDVVRGVSRMFLRNDIHAMAEVPLPNGRRADLMALDGKGLVTIVEIKVSRADLLGDGKWTDYLDYCDRFFWAVPQGFDLSLFERNTLGASHSGLIVADRYDAAIIREAETANIAPARRKAETLRLARLAVRRLLAAQVMDDGLGLAP
jgi:hypothetical protein